MKRYTTEAIDHCADLYLRFNGDGVRIEKEMRKEWPSWSRTCLKSSGKKGAKYFREGWVEKYGWDNRLKMAVALSGQRAATSAEILFLEIETHRRTLSQEIQKQGKNADRDLVYQHRDYCRLSVEALARLEAARNQLAGFTSMFEDLLKILKSESDQAMSMALRGLLNVSERVIEKARLRYAGNEQK
jgi:hypothetical protein